MSQESTPAMPPLSANQQAIVAPIVSKHILTKTWLDTLMPLLLGLFFGGLTFLIAPHYPSVVPWKWTVALFQLVLSLALVPWIRTMMRRKAIANFMRTITREGVIRRSLHADMGEVMVLAECRPETGGVGKDRYSRASIRRESLVKIMADCEAQGVPLTFDKAPTGNGGRTLIGKAAAGAAVGIAISR